MYSDKKIAKMIKAKIGKEEITHHAVTKHIKSCGWKIMQYGDDTCTPGNSTLQTLNLWQYANTHESLSYSDDKRNIIFINANRKTDILFLLLHEIAHIYCGHTKTGGVYGRDDLGAEKQANKIAKMLLQESRFKKLVKAHPAAAIGLVVTCTTLIIGSVSIAGSMLYINHEIESFQETQQTEPIPDTTSDIVQEQQEQPPMPTDPPATAAEITQGQTVWVAPSGTVYHTRRNCQSIVNNANVTAYDISEVANLPKCKHCERNGG